MGNIGQPEGRYGREVRPHKRAERRAGHPLQESARGDKRHKVAFRDARGMVTSKRFDHLEEAKAFRLEMKGLITSFEGCGCLCGVPTVKKGPIREEDQ